MSSSDFPSELWTKILSNVPRSDLLRIRPASRRIADIAFPAIFKDFSLSLESPNRTEHALERMQFWSTGTRAAYVERCSVSGYDADQRSVDALVEILPRFTVLRQLSLANLEYPPGILNAIASLPILSSLSITNSYLAPTATPSELCIPPNSLKLESFKFTLGDGSEHHPGLFGHWIGLLSFHTLTSFTIHLDSLTVPALTTPFPAVKHLNLMEGDDDVTLFDATRVLALFPGTEQLLLAAAVDIYDYDSPPIALEARMPLLTAFTGGLTTLAAIPGLLESALPTLRKLNANWREVRSCDTSIQFPGLKSLRLLVEHMSYAMMVEIAQRFAMVEELYLDVRYITQVTTPAFIASLVASPLGTLPASVRALDFTFPGPCLPLIFLGEESTAPSWPPVFPDPRALRDAYPTLEKLWVDDRGETVVYSWVKGLDPGTADTEVYYRRFEDPDGSEARVEYEWRCVAGCKEYWEQAQDVWKALKPDWPEAPFPPMVFTFH